MTRLVLEQVKYTNPQFSLVTQVPNSSCLPFTYEVRSTWPPGCEESIWIWSVSVSWRIWFPVVLFLPCLLPFWSFPWQTSLFALGSKLLVDPVIFDNVQHAQAVPGQILCSVTKRLFNVRQVLLKEPLSIFLLSDAICIVYLFALLVRMNLILHHGNFVSSCGWLYLLF